MGLLVKIRKHTLSVNTWIWCFSFQKIENLDVDEKDEANKIKQLKIIYNSRKWKKYFKIRDLLAPKEVSV